MVEKTIEDYRNDIKKLKTKLRKLKEIQQNHQEQTENESEQQIIKSMETISPQRCLYLVIKLQSFIRGHLARKFYKQFNQEDITINESNYLSLNKLFQKVKQILGISLEELYRGLDKESDEMIQVKEFKSFFVKMRLPLTKTQIKRQFYDFRCLFLFDEECEGKVFYHNFLEMIQAFQLQSEQLSPNKTAYDQLVIQKFLTVIQQEKLEEILPQLINFNNQIDLDYKLSNYLKRSLHPNFKERELFTIKRIFGDSPTQKNLQVILFIRKQNILIPQIFTKIYEKIGQQPQKTFSLTKKSKDFIEIIKKIQINGGNLTNVLIKVINDSAPCQEYFQPLFIKEIVEFYFSQILSTFEILQILNELNFEKDGTIHFEEISNFIFNNSKQEDQLYAKLIFMVRELEIKKQNTLSYFCNSHSIEKQKIFDKNEFVKTFQNIINISQYECIQLYVIMVHKFGMQNVTVEKIALYLDHLRTDSNRTQPLWAKESVRQQEEIIIQRKLDIKQALILKSKEVIEFKKFLSENQIDIFQQFTDKKLIKVQVLKKFFLSLKNQVKFDQNRHDYDIWYERKIVQWLDLIDIFKNQKLNVRQLQVIFLVDEEDQVKQNLIDATYTELEECQLNFHKILKNVHQTTKSLFNQVDFEQKQVVTLLRIKQSFSKFSFSLTEMLRVVYYIDPLCQNEIRLSNFNQLSMDKIDDIQLDFNKQRISYSDIRSSFRNIIHDSTDAIDTLRNFLFIDQNHEKNTFKFLNIFSQPNINRDTFLKLFDLNFPNFSDNHKIAFLQFADYQRSNQINIDDLMKMIKDYNYDVGYVEEINPEQQITVMKNSNFFGLRKPDANKNKNKIFQNLIGQDQEIKQEDIFKEQMSEQIQTSINIERTEKSNISEQRKNQSFIDFDFTEDITSLQKEKSPYQDLYTSTEFLSPYESVNQQFTFLHDISPGDVHSGLLGNCSLLSLLIILCQKKQLIYDIFETKTINNQDKYTLKLYEKGKLKLVTIAASFPCIFGQNLFIKMTHDIWGLLIEKALAKYYGTYDDLYKVPLEDLFQTLTNFPLIPTPTIEILPNFIYFAQSTTSNLGLIKDHYYSVLQNDVLMYSCGEVNYNSKFPLPQFCYEDRLNQDQNQANKAGIVIIHEKELQYFNFFLYQPVFESYESRSINVNKKTFFKIESKGSLFITVYPETGNYLSRFFVMDQEDLPMQEFDPNVDYNKYDNFTQHFKAHGNKDNSLKIQPIYLTQSFIKVQPSIITLTPDGESECILNILHTQSIKIQEIPIEDLSSSLTKNVVYSAQHGITCIHPSIFFNIFQDTSYSWSIFIENRDAVTKTVIVQLSSMFNIKLPKWVQNGEFIIKTDARSREVRTIWKKEWEKESYFDAEAFVLDHNE